MGNDPPIDADYADLAGNAEQVDSYDTPLPAAAIAQLDASVTKVIENTSGNRPAAGTEGRIFIESDTGRVLYDDGAAWNQVGVSAYGDLSGTPTSTQSASITGGYITPIRVSSSGLTNPGYFTDDDTSTDEAMDATDSITVEQNDPMDGCRIYCSAASGQTLEFRDGGGNVVANKNISTSGAWVEISFSSFAYEMEMTALDSGPTVAEMDVHLMALPAHSHGI